MAIRRRGISLSQMERLQMPPSGMMGYYFPQKGFLHCYDTSSYNPMYSDNTISIEDINNVVQDLQSLSSQLTEEAKKNVRFFGKYFFYILGVLLLIIVVSVILAITVTPFFFIAIPIIFVCCFVNMMCSLSGGISQAIKMQEEISARIDQVIAKHQNSTFAGKNVRLRMPMYKTYIAIDFLFRQNVSGAPQMQMNMYQPQAQPQFGNGFEINNQPQPYNQANQNAPIF